MFMYEKNDKRKISMITTNDYKKMKYKSNKDSSAFRWNSNYFLQTCCKFVINTLDIV